MSIFLRMAVVIASLLLALVFFYPLWEIGLIAPQYPEGLNLQIWADKITGDIRTINVLNHYIGMGKVEPDKFSELRYFPYLFGFLGLSGIVVAVINRRRMIQAWSVAFMTFALLGLYDFYSWEYHYGHELSDDAPMKMEESYDPPLIGTKQILTITASSYPGIGGYAFSAAAILSFLPLLAALRKKKVPSPA